MKSQESVSMSTTETFSPSELKKIDELRKRYPNTKALTLPVLWMAQEKWGHISRDIMLYVARLLEQPESHVFGVVSFYTMFKQRPHGRHHIEVCTNVSCMLRGSDKIVSHLRDRLGITFGETTPDGKFSLGEVECMGACGGAPMVAIGEEYHENLTLERLDQILGELK